MMLFNIFDILLLTYFGNEIKLSSDRFTYCLFESNWIEESESTKKRFIIFGELLMRPHEVLVLKIFPLTLEIFVKVICHMFVASYQFEKVFVLKILLQILNSAYTMFNVLKNFK